MLQRTALLNVFMDIAGRRSRGAGTRALRRTAGPEPGDVASPEAIVQAVYSVISGPDGAPRDWPRLRSLMAPGAIFVVTGAGADGTIKRACFSVEDYIAASSKAIGEHGVL